jgi:uncharacterized glyoxalase superfamily protein PhnB
MPTTLLAGRTSCERIVADVEDEYGRLLQSGAKEHTPLMDVGGGIRLGAVEDPFGNVLGTIHNPMFNLE